MNKVVTAFAAALLSTVEPVMAASASQTVNISMSVDQVLDLGVAVHRLDSNGIPTGANLGPVMPFGQLTRDVTYKVMRASQSFMVYLDANSSGRPYLVKATMPPLSNGAVTLPPAMVATVIAASSAADYDIPGDAFAGNGQNAIMDNQTIYTSNASGTAAAIQVVYGVSGGQAVGSPFSGWMPIPVSQASGNYTSSVTYTIALS